jgi:hypothetical protein
MEQNAENVKEGTLPEAGSEVKTASQLKKEAKRLEKLEKFKKKKEAQEAEKINQAEVSTYQIRHLKNYVANDCKHSLFHFEYNYTISSFLHLEFQKKKDKKKKEDTKKVITYDKDTPPGDKKGKVINQ